MRRNSGFERHRGGLRRVIWEGPGKARLLRRYERRALRVFQVIFQVISRDCIAQSNAKGFGL